jgi:hypothetical protein
MPLKKPGIKQKNWRNESLWTAKTSYIACGTIKQVGLIIINQEFYYDKKLSPKRR